jgi:hypothetical protein
VKPNFVGIVGGIIAFISLAMPWWTMMSTSTLLGTPISASLNLYLYRFSVTYGFDIEIGEKLWFGWIALVLVLVSGVLGIVGGIKRKKSMLSIGGVFSMSSIAIFVVGLLTEMPSMPILRESDIPNILFYSGIEGTQHLSVYLSFGFWLALVAGIMMLVASTLKWGEGKPSTLLQPTTAGARTLSSVPTPSEHKYCIACGTMLQEDDVFCRRCGRRTVYTHSTMICPRCRNHLPLDSRFCPKCGADFFPELTKT